MRRGAWPVAFCLLLVVIAASTPLIGLVQGSAWWWELVGVGGVLVLAPAVLRTLGVPRWAASVLDIVVFAALVFAQWGAGTTIAGVIPTAETFDRLGALYAAAWDSIQHQAVPATEQPELLFFIAGFGGIFALVLDVVASALRLPTLVGAALLPVVIVPAILLPDGVPLWSLALCAFAFLLVLWAAGRVRRGRRGGAAAAAAIAAGATAVALVASLLAPGYQSGSWKSVLFGDVGYSRGIDPLVDLSRDLHNPLPREVLRYTTTGEGAPYLQLTTLDSFEGAKWHRSGGDTVPVGGGGQLAAPPGLSVTAQGDRVTTHITIESLVSQWLPVPYPATSVESLSGLWQQDPQDLAVSPVTGTVSGQSYTVTSTTLDPDVSSLRTLYGPRFYPASVRNDLELPDNVPQVIVDTAKAATKDASNLFDKAVALQNYFHLGSFTYSTDTPSEGESDGMQAIVDFLDRKSGYCVHFSSAMAVMARVLGIPSRIAIGYLPGAAKLGEGNSIYYAVSSDSLHAWPQLYFEGVGWLNFEPTVSLGVIPSYTQKQGSTATAPSSSPSAEAPSPSATAAAPTDAPQDPGAQQQAGGVAAASAGWYALGILAIVVVVGLVPFGVRRLRRTIRMRRLAATGSPAVAWAEVVDTARDLGISMPRTETPRVLAARLAGGLGAASVDLWALLDAVERSAYGPPAPARQDPALAARARHVLDALAASRPAGARWRAVFAPASLVAPR